MSWRSSSDDDEERSDSVDEFCVCCDDKRADPYLQLEDGYYCSDCYESQKSW
jgi:hypothetical protein